MNTFKKKLSAMATKKMFNSIPAHYFSGSKLTKLCDDYRYCQVKLERKWRTKGAFGHIFGGLMYSSVDAVPAFLLVKNMGKDVVIWDKTGQIKYLKTGYCQALYCDHNLTEDVLQTIKDTLDKEGVCTHQFKLELRDNEGDLYAVVTKEIHLEKRALFLERKNIKSKDYQSSFKRQS